ncbi:SDR family oxidoreductase [Nocardia sp. NPDC056611]|uniref:SDR family oxidoreductase n=1 Tax=Nocardia sp. NPDC056611 TaxID=3345877 RepID=UPI003670FF05
MFVNRFSTKVDEDTLRGKRVVITGGARGIGRAIAAQFVDAGARVVLGDVDGDAAHQTAVELGNGTVGVALDVSDSQSFAAFLDTAEDAMGPMTVMINNAGVDWMGPFHSEPAHASRRQLEVNLMGPIIGSKLALQRMLPRGTGHLVNIASAAGRVPQPGSAVYTATKYGVVGLTEALRLEYRDSGVRFSVVHPGQVQTRMIEGTGRASRLLRVISPDDCARAVVDAVRHNRFEVWAPADQRIGVQLGHMVPRALREKVMLALRVDAIARQADESVRGDYHERAFGRGR